MRIEFIDKDMTLDQRQNLDFLFWGIIISLGATIFYGLLDEVCILGLLIFPLIIFINLMWRNNKIALKEIKKRKENEN